MVDQDEQVASDLVERAARWVAEKRLEAPVIFLLEMHKPVAPLGSMLLLGAMPFVGPFIGFSAMERLALFVEDRSNVERLIARIEELSGTVSVEAAGKRTPDGEETGT